MNNAYTPKPFVSLGSIWAACKVQLSGMQIFENYAVRYVAPMLLARTVAGCIG